MSKGKKVRVNRVSELGVHWPSTARMLIECLTKECLDNYRNTTSFSVPGLPLSLNHQYFHTNQFRKTKKGKTMMVQGKALKPEVHEFRQLVAQAMQTNKQWRSTGVTAMVVLFESPAWLTQDFTARKMDQDNKLKPLADAIEQATGVADQLHWEIHTFKVASLKKERTVVYLFDLGDIVELYT